MAVLASIGLLLAVAAIGLLLTVAAVRLLLTVATISLLLTVTSLTVLAVALLGAVLATVATAVLGLGVCVALGGESLALITLIGVVGGSGKLATLGDSAASHHDTIVASLDLVDLLAFLPLTVGHVTLSVGTNLDTSLLKGTIVSLAVVAVGLAMADTVLTVATIGAVATVATVNTSASVILGIPVAVAVSVSVRGDPSVDTDGISLFVLVVPVGGAFVLTVKGDSGGVCHLLSLGVILDDLPVLFNGNIDVSELDLSLLLLFDLGEFLPLDGENETVTASGVDVGDNPNVLDISGHDLLEGLKGELLLVGPLARGLLGLFVGDGEGLGDNFDL